MLCFEHLKLSKKLNALEGEPMSPTLSYQEQLFLSCSDSRTIL